MVSCTETDSAAERGSSLSLLHCSLASMWLQRKKGYGTSKAENSVHINSPFFSSTFAAYLMGVRLRHF